jgi:hypothetical protein
MNQHEEIEGWLERSGQVLDENAQAMRVAGTEALLDRAFGMTDRLAEVRRATDAGIVDEVSPEAMARVMASMAEEFAAARPTPEEDATRPPITMADMLRLQRRHRKAEKARRDAAWQAIVDAWNARRAATSIDATDVIRGGS